MRLPNMIPVSRYPLVRLRPVVPVGLQFGTSQNPPKFRQIPVSRHGAGLLTYAAN